MTHLIGRRLLTLIPLLLLVSLAVVSSLYLVPGDPAITLSGENASAEKIEQTRVRLGLDQPLRVQYSRWVGDAVKGDLGTSLYSSQKVTTALVERAPVTLSLTFLAMAFALLVSIPVGILAASRPHGWVDRAATGVASIGVAMPSFWVGMLLIIVFTVNTRLLPPVGYVPFGESPTEWFRHLIMPAISLGLVAAAETIRQLRGALVDVLSADYIRTAEAKGLRHRTVILRHALKNAAVPAVTVIGFQLTYLLGGSVIIESMFGLPGLGQLAIDSVIARDVPMIQGIVLVAVLVAVTSNLLVDISYGLLNPKVRVR